jgi:glucokinase
MGIDYGGTKILAAIVDTDTGDILGTAKKRSRMVDGPEELLERLYSLGDDALKATKGKASREDLVGIGIGIAGQVDSERGILLGTPNLSRATVELPIAQRLQERFGVPTALANDVQIAAMGEQRFGAGKDVDDFLCVFVGTGIGGAIVQKSQLVRGATATAGEIGHIVVQSDGRLCGCGGRGHLEAYASRTAITQTLLGDLKRGRQSILTELVPAPSEDAPGGTAIRSGILARAVKANDPLVTETISQAGHYLGLGLASAINLLNPQRIILGGGVIEAVDLLFEVASNNARRESLPVPGQKVEIFKAALGDYSGVIGAALLGVEFALADREQVLS